MAIQSIRWTKLQPVHHQQDSGQIHMPPFSTETAHVSNKITAHIARRYTYAFVNVCNNQLDHTSSACAPDLIHNEHLMFTRKEWPYPAAGALFSGQKMQTAKSLLRKRPSAIAHACPQGSNHKKDGYAVAVQQLVDTSTLAKQRPQ